MLSLSKFLIEEKNTKHGVMTFGRMNPPTTGHMKVIDKIKTLAAKYKTTGHVIVSHSHDPKKNPLTSTQKIKHLKRYAPDMQVSSSSKEHPSILHAAANFHKKGVEHLHVVVGSDRVEEMKKLLNSYNGKKSQHGEYNFKKITVHSSGNRDPDSEGTEGMSASKMREHASNKDFHSFRAGVPSHVSDTHAKELFKDVRSGMSHK